jgi:hypothetical protein
MFTYGWRCALLAVGALWSAGIVRAEGGHEVVGGGEVAECRAVPQAAWVGLYMVDYLATSTPAGDADLVPVSEVDASLARIGELVTSVQRDAGLSFAAYVRLRGNHDDATAARIWRPTGTFPLVDLDDQALVRALPDNCLSTGPDGKITTLQAVVREARPNVVIYNYDADLVDRVAAAPIQLSFLYVHEWLRDYTTAAPAIRDANRLLHSASFARSTPEQRRSALERVGVDLSQQQSGDDLPHEACDTMQRTCDPRHVDVEGQWHDLCELLFSNCTHLHQIGGPGQPATPVRITCLLDHQCSSTACHDIGDNCDGSR